MASTSVVDRGEFTKRLLEELQRRFVELHAKGAVEEAGDFVRATISLDFVVSARNVDQPKPCCVCVRYLDGILCQGECCKDLIDVDAHWRLNPRR